MRWRDAVRRLAVVIGSAAAAVVLVPAAAQAHAVLEATNPQAGSEIQQLPAEVTLSFGEDVTVNEQSLKVVSPSGSRVDTRAVRHPGGNGAQVAVGIPASLPHGSYTVVWRVVSADSHPVAGTFTFGYGVPAGETVPAPHGAVLVGFLNGAARFVGFIGIALAAGTLAFVGAVWNRAWQRRRVRLATVVGLGLLALSSTAQFLLAGPYDAGEGISSTLSGPLLHQTFDTRYGRLLAVRLAIAVLGLVLLVLHRGSGSGRVRLDLIAIAAVGLLTFSLSEHAGIGRQVPLAVIADAVHLGAVCVWLGGLVTLLLLIVRSPNPLPSSALRRWSNVAFGSVAAIVVTGAYASWREVGTFPAFPDTPYGRLLLVKIGLLALLIALGAYGRRRVHATDFPEQSPGGLRRSVGGEIALSAGVLAVAAILVDVQPGRDSYDPAHTMRVAAHGTGSTSLDTRIRVNTTRPGPATYAVTVRKADGKPQSYQEIEGLLTDPAAGLGPVRFSFAASPSGSGSATAVVIPSPGRWQLELQIRTDDVTAYAATTTYLVR